MMTEEARLFRPGMFEPIKSPAMSIPRSNFETYVLCAIQFTTITVAMKQSLERKSQRYAAMLLIQNIYIKTEENHVVLRYLRRLGKREVIIWNHSRYIHINS